MAKRIKITELEKITGIEYSTLKYYCEIGILDCEQEKKEKARYFTLKKSVRRLKTIKEMRKKGYKIKDLIKYFEIERRKYNKKKQLKLIKELAKTKYEK